MQIRQDVADFPTMGDAAVEAIVVRVRAAAASGDRPLVVVGGSVPVRRSGTRGDETVDLEQLRLGFVSRAEALLWNRPERGRILPQIHRYFDEQSRVESGRALEDRLGRAVLASVLAVRIREQGLRVAVEPSDLPESLRFEESNEADVVIRTT
jgi:hypothetical protein